MKLINLLEKTQTKLTQKSEELTKWSFDKKAKINNLVTSKLNKQQKKIINLFYSNYPEIPYISQNRDSKWINMAMMMPKQSLVKKEMMVRFSDDLLPGHVYMLYWLQRYTNKKVPEYFEYKYGINFSNEKEYLKENNYLNVYDKPTQKGEQAILVHSDVIIKHNPKQLSPEEQIMLQHDQMIKNGFTEYEFIANSGCCEICQALDGKIFKVKDMIQGLNAPPMHPRCRCAIAPYSNDAEYEAWLDYLDKGGSTAEWKKINKKT